jgi:hypothetical protein
MFLTKQLIEDTLRDDGWTMFLANEKYTGYIVAESGIIISLDEFKRGYTLTHFINNAYDNGYDLVGTWVNEGQVHLDRCVHFDRLNDADNFARKNNQLAFYNIGGDFVIFC